MSEGEGVEDAPESAQRRSKLVSRAVLVVALIVALLAGLMIFDGKPGQEANSRAPVAAALSSPRIGISVSAVPSSAAPPATSSMPEELKQAIQNAPDATQAALASMPEPVAHQPPTAVPEGSSDVVLKGREEPGAGSLHGTPAASTARQEPPRAAPSLHSSSVITNTAVEMGPFLLQVGVFSNPGNAEELRSKLRQAGIPTQTETRVQVGPFASKSEALKAQERLRKLGLGSGMLLPTGGKRP